MSNFAAPPPPPRASQLPYGTRLVAGLGFATVLPEIDFETYSEAGYVWNPYHVNARGQIEPRWDPLPGVSPQDKGLPSIGACVYSEHPSTEILVASYDLKDGRGVRRWNPGDPFPEDLRQHIENGGLIESHNCGFEFWIWLNVWHKRYGFPMIPSAQQRCSQAKARAHALPPSLENLGKALRLDIQKDAGGKDLMNKFSMPQKPSAKDPRTRHLMSEDLIEAERYRRYCDRDVETEGEASARIPDLSPSELEWWLIDQSINRRGVGVDVAAVRASINVIEQAFTRYNGELLTVTGGIVPDANKLEQLKAWLATQGVYTTSLDADHVEKLMKERHRFPPAAARALEIRALIGSSAVKKLYAMNNQASSVGRLHDLFGYHAARTGRTNGQGPQPTNLPNSGPEVRICVCRRHYGKSKPSCPWCGAVTPPAPPDPLPNKGVVEWNADAASDAIEILRSGSLDLVELFWDSAIEIVSASLRGMYVAAEGCDLISSDYTAIEAVVLAELAGEQWRIDLFKAGGKIYEASGAKIMGITYEEAIAYKERTGNHHKCRKVGKIAELAGGYQGWIGAYKQFGADEFMTDEEIKQAVLAWRKASPMIVELWGGQERGGWNNRRTEYYGLEGMAIQAVANPGKEFSYRGITYFMRGDVLYCRLLSGRLLTYHEPRLRPGDRSPLALSYMGWNTNPKMGPYGWIRMDTYGGKLTENVVQATARDILVHAIVNLWRKGYLTVLHIYDEIVAEIAKGFGSIEEFEAVMNDLPEFARGWPVSASGGWRGGRFRK